MSLYQVNIFGERQKVIKTDNPEYKPKKLNKQGQILKQKLEKLYRLYERLYLTQEISLLEQREIIVKDDLIIYPDERQAEPIVTVQMNVLNDIDKRITIAEEKCEKYEFMKECAKRWGKKWQ